MFSLLPHEVGIVFVSFLGPVLVLIFLFIFSKLARTVTFIAEESHRHGAVINQILERMGLVVEETQQSRQAVLADVEAHKALSWDISKAIEGQSAGLENMASKLSSDLKSYHSNADSTDPNDIRQMSTLIDLFNAALGDLSVATTQILVLLLQKERRARNDIKDFVGGLVEAYTTGDRNVFFRVLQRQLTNVPSRVKTLQTLSTDSPELRNNISKVLREVREIMSLVGRCDRDNLVRIIFEEGELRALQQELSRHFEEDGTAKA